MRVLYLATKEPWPPVDGGRLLIHNTLHSLADHDVELTYVAPCAPERVDAATRALTELGVTPALVPRDARSRLGAALVSVFSGRPLSIERHRLTDVRATVADRLARVAFDLVHGEQLQTIANLPSSSPPVVLRAQNVESDLWRAVADSLGGPRGAFLGWQARRLRRYESRVANRVASVIALTTEDATAFTRFGATPEIIAAPFASELPSGPPLSGEPALIVGGSGGWWPNRQGVERFLTTMWPAARKAFPTAELHLFGADRDDPKIRDERVHLHPAPDDSRKLFAQNGVLVVPLWIASGVRIKILEAWARGIPVIATATAARGLGATPGRELMLADTGEQLVDALGTLDRERVITAGRRRLQTVHDPARLATALVDIWRHTVNRASG
ncbi:MAG: glycosyltransferase [Acidobacteriota bacterium]